MKLGKGTLVTLGCEIVHAFLSLSIKFGYPSPRRLLAVSPTMVADHEMEDHNCMDRIYCRLQSITLSENPHLFAASASVQPYFPSGIASQNRYTELSTVGDDDEPPANDGNLGRNIEAVTSENISCRGVGNSETPSQTPGKRFPDNSQNKLMYPVPVGTRTHANILQISMGERGYPDVSTVENGVKRCRYTVCEIG